MNVFTIGVAHKGSGSLLASPYMEKELRLLGVATVTMAAKDDIQLESCFAQAAAEGGLILTPLTGSQQVDQLMLENVAKICGVGLGVHQKALEQMSRRLPQEEAVRMATLPKGAHIFAFNGREIPAFQINGSGFQVIVLPADQIEQTGLFFSYIFPLFAKAQQSSCVVRVVRTMELSLSQVEGALKDMLSSQNPTVAVYPKADEVVIRIAARAKDRQEAANGCIAAMKAVVERLGGYVYGVDVNSVEHALVQKAVKRGISLAIAESGTREQAAKRLAQVPEGKELLAFHFSCNADASLGKGMDISDKLLKKWGIVSPQTASAMADSAASQKENAIGIGLTLPTAEVKSATAYVAAAMNGKVLTSQVPVAGSRSIGQLTETCISQAMNLARKFADTYPAPPKGAIPLEEAVAASASAMQAGEIETQQKGSGPMAVKEQPSKRGAGKKQPLLKRLAQAILPQKDDPKSEKIRKAGILLCCCVFLGSMGYLIYHHQTGVNAGKENSRLNDMLAQAEAGNLKVDEEKLAQVPEEVLEKYKPFVAINDDMKGWVKIEGTDLSYPVVQADDNEFYHRKNFECEYDYYGVPYLDYECSIKTSDVSDNLIVYGHNIGNDGLMFNPVTYYKQLDFYKQHPVINFDTIYQEGQYKIFGVFITNAQPEQDNGTVFNYQQFVDAGSEKEFNDFVEEVRRRSMYDIDVDVQPGDKLLTLSTCTYDFRPEARCVVVARKVRDGEDPSVNTANAIINADAYYPQAYYDAKNEAAKYGQVKGIKIEGKSELTINVGETLQLKATTEPATAPINTCTWDSSNSAVATVDKKTGFVTAVSPGEVIITAMADDGGYAASVKITVKAKDALEYLGLDPEELSIQVGQESKITAIVSPEGANVDLEWAISDTSKLYGAVSKSNNRVLNIQGLAEGQVTVTVTDKITKKQATCTVNIYKATQITGLTFRTSTEQTLAVDEVKTVEIMATPEGAKLPDNAIIEWVLEDGTIVRAKAQTDAGKGATRASNTVTGLKAGTTRMYARIKGTNIETDGYCTFTVTNGEVKLTVNPSQVEVKTGATATFTVLVNPANQAQNLKFETDYGLVQVQQVSNNGSGLLTFNVTARDTAGEDAVIFTINGKEVGRCKVIVGSSVTALTGVSITPGSATIEEGEYVNLGASPSPSGSTIKTYDWSSSDTSVATVDSQGTVSGHKAGTATIKLVASDANGNKVVATMTVTVKAPQPTVEICSECGRPVNSHAENCTKNPNYKPPEAEKCQYCGKELTGEHTEATCPENPANKQTEPDPSTDPTTNPETPPENNPEGTENTRDATSNTPAK